MAKDNKNNSSKGETKFSAEDEMMPHSEAKVALYGSYLEKYLAILGVVNFIKQINVYDVFCGTGIYSNGKYGSPVVAHQVINKVKGFLKDKNPAGKPTNLIVNDGNSESIHKVTECLTRLNSDNPCCKLSFHNLDARAMFDKIIASIRTQDSSVRNLIFIDPTGYKEIHRDDLQKLLEHKKSEVVLFLPISFMYRFKGVVQKNFDNPSYVHLRRLISEFFDQDHPIRKNEPMSVFKFIEYLEEALCFKRQFCSTSFFLQRNTNSYYALFFITPSMLGLEKVIEAKWNIDKERGKGFIYNEKSKPLQLTLFTDNKPSALDERMKELEASLIGFIKTHPNCSNCRLYEVVLQNDCKPSHGTQILTKLQDDRLIEVWDKEKNKEARKNSFYVNNEYYKLKRERVTFKIV